MKDIANSTVSVGMCFLLLCMFLPMWLEAGEDSLRYEAVRDVNMRSGPGNRYEVVRVIEKGDTLLQAVAGKGTGWLRFMHEGTEGYVYANNLRLLPQEEAVPEEEVLAPAAGGIFAILILFYLVLGIILFVLFLVRPGRRKNRGHAVLLVVFYGYVGLHKFYLGKWLAGIVYILLSWTMIPFLLAFIDFIILLAMSEEAFAEKYGQVYQRQAPVSVGKQQGHRPRMEEVRKESRKKEEKQSSLIFNERTQVEVQKESTSAHTSVRKEAEKSTDEVHKRKEQVPERQELNDSLPVGEEDQDLIDVTDEEEEVLNIRDDVDEAEEVEKPVGDRKNKGIAQLFDVMLEGAMADDDDYGPEEGYYDRATGPANAEDFAREDQSWHGEVPVWEVGYIYSTYDLYESAPEVSEYYRYFKYRFLTGEPITDAAPAYVYTLLYDLTDCFYEEEYDKQRVYAEMVRLGEVYPTAMRYVLNRLLHILCVQPMDAWDRARVKELEDPLYQYEQGYIDYYPYDHQLGIKYKEELNLTKKEAAWLNKFDFSPNAFTEVQGCLFASIRLYCLLLKKLEYQCKKEGNTLTKRVEAMQQFAIEGSPIYDSDSGARRSVSRRVYLTLFKKAENIVREQYLFAPKLRPAFELYGLVSLNNAYDTMIGDMADDLLAQLRSEVLPLDKETHHRLFEQSAGRWKKFMALYKTALSAEKMDAQTYFLKIEELSPYLKKEPKKQAGLWYSAFRNLLALDKVRALQAYAYHVDTAVQPGGPQVKPLSNAHAKKLFKGADEQQAFEAIIQELLEHRDIAPVLKTLETFYLPKRKKIALDSSLIDRAEAKLDSTVERLNDYLTDAEEGEKEGLEEIAGEEAFAENKPKEESKPVDAAGQQEQGFAGQLPEAQRALFLAFENAGYSLSREEVRAIASSHGTTETSLIDDLNETCSEHLDGEVLIEEEGDDYVVEESYYTELIS